MRTRRWNRARRGRCSSRRTSSYSRNGGARRALCKGRYGAGCWRRCCSSCWRRRSSRCRPRGNKKPCPALNRTGFQVAVVIPLTYVYGFTTELVVPSQVEFVVVNRSTPAGPEGTINAELTFSTAPLQSTRMTIAFVPVQTPPSTEALVAYVCAVAEANASAINGNSELDVSLSELTYAQWFSPAFRVLVQPLVVPAGSRMLSGGAGLHSADFASQKMVSFVRYCGNNCA